MIPRICSNKSRLTIQGKSARCALLALHIAALTVPASAATQGASHPEPGDIVVSARAAKLGERVNDVVQTLTPPTDNQMIARWTGSLCFSIDGLSPPQRSVFEQVPDRRRPDHPPTPEIFAPLSVRGFDHFHR